MAEAFHILSQLKVAGVASVTNSCRSLGLAAAFAYGTSGDSDEALAVLEGLRELQLLDSTTLLVVEKGMRKASKRVVDCDIGDSLVTPGEIFAREMWHERIGTWLTPFAANQLTQLGPGFFWVEFLVPAMIGFTVLGRYAMSSEKQADEVCAALAKSGLNVSYRISNSPPTPNLGSLPS